MAAAIRLVHPFPSLLDGLVVAAVGLVAGAPPALALRLGLSMIALQASIGALNDLHDAPVDAGRKPGKPIPAGLVDPPAARAIVVGAAIVGLVLALSVDIRVAVLAVVVLLIGYGYDLVAKGTAWSWLPFAIGIPILPVYGWFGAAADVPPLFAALIPMTVLAGAALAIANARADAERDRSAGIVSVATRLGLEGSWRLGAVLWLATLLTGLGWMVFRGVELGSAAVVAVAAGHIGVVVVWSRDLPAAGRERAWELQAAGATLALVAWLVAVIR